MKKDAVLGKEVANHIMACGVESPINYDVYNEKTSDIKINLIEEKMREILEIIGFDLTNDSVENTPHRVAKMWVNEVMSGLDYNNFPKIMTFENKFNAAGMVSVRSLKSMSLCSHHLVTIDGLAHVAYIPGSKIIGLSKIARIVDFFSRRPQEAERLTLQIYHALQYILETDNIAVFIAGVHYCMKARGASEADSDTCTVKLGGQFLNDPQVRKEFYDIVHSSK